MSNIKNMSMIELKSLAYDGLVSIQNIQQSIAQINQEIANRNKIVPIKETDELKNKKVKK